MNPTAPSSVSFSSFEVYILTAAFVLLVVMILLFAVFVINHFNHRPCAAIGAAPQPTSALQTPANQNAGAPPAQPALPPAPTHPNLVRSEAFVVAFYNAAREEIKLRLERREQSTIIGLTGIFVLLGTALARPWAGHPPATDPNVADPSFWLANLACWAVLATMWFVSEHQRAVRYLQRYIGYELLTDLQPKWPPAWDESQARFDFVKQRRNPLGQSFMALVILSGFAALVIAYRFFPDAPFDWGSVNARPSRAFYGIWTLYKGHVAMSSSACAIAYAIKLVWDLYYVPCSYTSFIVLKRP